MEIRRKLWFIDIAGVFALMLVVGGIYLRWSKLLEKYSTSLLIIGYLGIVLYVVYHLPLLYRLYRQYRLFWLEQVGYIMLVFGILALINFVAYRHNFSYDATKEKRHLLSSETVKIVKQLQEPVRILGFFSDSEEDRQKRKDFEELIEKYRALSPKIQYERIDYTLRPTVAEAYNVTLGGTVILEKKDRKVRITNLNEEALTNGIVELTEQLLDVCFISGHREKDIDSFEQEGYGDLSRLLAQKGFTTRSFTLAQTGKVPEDCAVVVLAGPENPLLDEEWKALWERWQNRGGILILLDPFKDRKFNSFFQPLGIRFGTELVIDPLSIVRTGFLQQQLAAYPILQGASSYDTQFEVVKEMQNEITIFPLASPVWTDKTPPGITVHSFLKTSDQSWAEKEIKDSTVEFTPGKDTRGPIPIGVAVEQDGRRMILIGDSDFAVNGNAKNVPGNHTLFLNSIRWLAKKEKFISIPAKEEEPQPVNIPIQHARQIFFLFLLLIPSFFFFFGIFMWWTRKKL
ncbi:MAG: GldG family protein [bacterium JZ-2024 1]